MKLEPITNHELARVSGGLQWEKFRQSKNVEDRRTPAGIRRDQRWWDRNHPPLPPRRPEGL